MEKEELYQLSFQLILYSGNARSFAMEALQEAKKKNFDSARLKIAEAETELLQAHRYQTQLIHAEAGGDHFDLPIILVHAQDHLMTAMTVKDLAMEMIDLREEFLHANVVKERTAE